MRQAKYKQTKIMQNINLNQVESKMNHKTSEREFLMRDRSGDALNGGPTENMDSVAFKMFTTQKNKEN